MGLHRKREKRRHRKGLTKAFPLEDILSELSKTAVEFMNVWVTKENVQKFIEKIHGIYKRRMEKYYDVDEYGMDKGLVEMVRPVFQFLYRDYWRVSVDGIENIPQEGPAIIVCNHSGTLPYDSAMLNMAVFNEHPKARYVRFLVEDFVYYFPFLGTFINRLGGVRACQENAERLLKGGELIAVFPEGVKGLGKLYKDRYRLERFGRGGFIKLAIKTKAPVIPTAIIGAEEIHPIILKSALLAKLFRIPYFPVTYTWPHFGILGLIPLPSKWSITFGKPVNLKRYSVKTLDNKLLIHRLTEDVRGTIQKMIDDGLKKRGTPF